MWTNLITGVLATIGLIDTSSITFKKWGLFTSLSCPGIENSCETVLNSPWGTLFENNQIIIPLSFAGFITYMSILILVLLESFTKRRTATFLFNISLASTIFSFLLIYIMFFKIQAYCFFCILSAILSTSICLISATQIKLNFSYIGIIISTVLIAGLIWSNYVDPSNNAIDVKQLTENESPNLTTSSSTQKINFAKFLSESNIVMYSAYWCPHCHDQKQLFGKEAVKELKVVECAKNGKDSEYELCQTKGIRGLPSWEINGEIISGTRDLNELATKTDYQGDLNF